MAEVLVMFPETGDEALVNQNLVRGPQGRRISWDFLSCNPDIRCALVYFEQADFFGPGRKWYIKELDEHKQHIWGIVPEYGTGKPAIAAKYWVMGFEMELKEVVPLLQNGTEPEDLKTMAACYLDPIVVTGEPH